MQKSSHHTPSNDDANYEPVMHYTYIYTHTERERETERENV